jgi:hypothetical protein
VKWLLAVALVFLGMLSAQRQGAGSVSGVVLSEEGIPIKSAIVHTTNNRPLGGRVPAALTDETGHFVMHDVGFDEYEIRASNEAEDYPELDGVWLLFYKKPSWPKVNLTAQEPNATVEVQLGPKTAVLVGTISNAITGAPLSACGGFSPVSQPNSTTASPMDPTFRLLIPADAEVAIKVWLEGYKPWYYPGTDRQSASTSMRLQPGEEKKVNVRLRRKKNEHAALCGIRIMF